MILELSLGPTSDLLFDTLKIWQITKPILTIDNKIASISLEKFYAKNLYMDNLLAILPENERVQDEISYMELVSNAFWGNDLYMHTK